MLVCVYVCAGLCIGEGEEGKRGVRDLPEVVWRWLDIDGGGGCVTVEEVAFSSLSLSLSHLVQTQ